MAFDDNLLAEGGTLLIDNAFVHGAAYCPSENNTLAHDVLEAAKTCKQPLHRVSRIELWISQNVCPSNNVLNLLNIDFLKA